MIESQLNDLKEQEVPSLPAHVELDQSVRDLRVVMGKLGMSKEDLDQYLEEERSYPEESTDALRKKHIKAVIRL